MRKIYKIKLTKKKRKALEKVVNKGKHSSREIKRANILLLAADGKTEREIGEITNIGHAAISRVKKRYIEDGLENALKEKERSGRPEKLDGKGKAQVTAIACSKTPAGHINWSMQMIADKLVELKVVNSISDETVRRILKKNRIKTMEKTTMVHR